MHSRTTEDKSKTRDPKTPNKSKQKTSQLLFATHPTNSPQGLSYCPVVNQSEQTSYCTPRNRAVSSPLGAISAEDLLILFVVKIKILTSLLDVK